MPFIRVGHLGIIRLVVVIIVGSALADGKYGGHVAERIFPSLRRNRRDETIVEGDTLLSKKDKSHRNGIIGEQFRWPNRTLVWDYGPQGEADFTKVEKKVIQDAMKHIEKRTAIRFRQRGSKDEDYLLLVSSGGCQSSIGRRGGPQRLLLGGGCANEKNTVVHELVHAIGIRHEQNRSDRDDYVSVDYENVHEGQRHNFRKYSKEDVDHFGVPYNFNSIMHYGPYDWAVDSNKPVLTPKKVTKDISVKDIGPLSEGLTALDILKIHRMYNVTNYESNACTIWDCFFSRAVVFVAIGHISVIINFL